MGKIRDEEQTESQRALERLRLAVEAGGVGFWDWNVRDDVYTSSAETERLYRVEPGETLTFRRWMERIHRDDRDLVERAVREALSGASAGYDVEFRLGGASASSHAHALYPSDPSEKEERWLWAKGTVHRDPSGVPIRVIGVNIDVTSRKKAELERERAAARMRHANELKDDFLAMLGHELRNPLGAIVNGIALLRSDTGSDQREWATEMIHRQTEQLKRIVDDILEVSRVARGQLEIRPEVVSLPACVESARDAVRERLERNHRDFEVRLPGERICLFVDPARMQQILGNLLSNAIKYTEPGGRILLSAERQGDRVRICVEDDGEGLSEEHLEVVFEPFVRVSASLPRAGSGLGIGLTLVKRLVELHGGTVTAESKGPATGSAFVVVLPIHTGVPAPQAGRSRDPQRPLRILIVDDNEDLAIGLKKRLEQRGHEVALSYDGPAGIATARRMKPDVVLIDVGLPSMDGYQVAKELRADGSAAPKIAGISGFKERGEEEIAAEAFDHYFLKPVDAEQLNTWLNAISAERSEAEGRP